MCFWHLKLISIEWPIESTKSNSTSCTFVYKPLIATCWKLARWFGTRAAPRNLLGTTARHKLSPAAQTRAKRFLNPTRACELPRPSSSFSLPSLDQTSCSYSLPSLPYEYHIRCLMCQITKTHVPRWTSSVTYIYSCTTLLKCPSLWGKCHPHGKASHPDPPWLVSWLPPPRRFLHSWSTWVARLSFSVRLMSRWRRRKTGCVVWSKVTLSCHLESLQPGETAIWNYATWVTSGSCQIADVKGRYGRVYRRYQSNIHVIALSCPGCTLGWSHISPPTHNP